MAELNLYQVIGELNVAIYQKDAQIRDLQEETQRLIAQLEESKATNGKPEPVAK